MIAATGFPTSGDPDRAKDAARVRKHFDFKFEKITQDYQYVDTDVLIIGSGAGGGVVASEMAEKGWSTLVVEKGIYQRPEEMTTTPKDGFFNLYEGQGLMATEDGGMNVLAGSSFGGGTVSELPRSTSAPRTSLTPNQSTGLPPCALSTSFVSSGRRRTACLTSSPPNLLARSTSSASAWEFPPTISSTTSPTPCSWTLP